LVATVTTSCLQTAYPESTEVAETIDLRCLTF
jgi:hypothetical protein